MSTYPHALKQHLAVYKRERLGIEENGSWRRNGKPYEHILPERLQKLNLLEGIRAEFWGFWPRTKSRLHDDFHHLNSSQAMCFNLFFPLLPQSRMPATNTTQIFGPSAYSFARMAFEEIPDPAEGTNFDFFLQDSSGRRIYVEMKLTETDFGSCANDKPHAEKLRGIYRPKLSGKVADAALEPEIFFKNYQLLRNVSHLHKEDRLLIVYPRANSGLERGIQFLKSILSSNTAPQVEVVHVEDFVARFATAVNSYRLIAHYAAFREKYLPQLAS